MMTILRLGLICFTMLLAPCLACGAEDALRWKFESGDEHHYRMTQTMDMGLTLVAANRTIETTAKQVVDWHWKVENVDDQGNATIVLKAERLRANMKAPGLQKMHLDTATKKSPTGFAAMLVPVSKALDAESATMTLSPLGAIKNLEIPERLLDAIETVPNGIRKMAKPVENSDEDSRREESFKESLQHSLFTLPQQKEFTEDEAWTLDGGKEFTPFGTIKSTTTYRYTGSRELDGKSYETFSAKSTPVFASASENLQIEVINHVSDGEVLFDRTAGRLQSNKLKQQTELKFTSDGQETLVKIIQHSHFELVQEPEEERP